MTLNSKLPTYKEEASRITEDSKDYSYMKTQIINLAQRAFTDGVVSIMQKQKVKSKKEAVEELNEDISDYYLDKNIEVLNEYFMSIIREYTKNGKLVMGYEEAIAKDFRNVAKAIYDMGLISGVTVAQDPIKLEVFLKNKEKLEDGTY
jgi:hypothetical protein